MRIQQERLVSTETKSPVMMYLFNEDMLERHWHHIARWLEAMPHTRPNHTTEDLYNRALNRAMQVWAVGDPDIKGVLFTQVVVYSVGNVLEVFWGAGLGLAAERFRDIVDSNIDHFARIQNCIRIDVIGRRGWEKLMIPRGFKQTAVILSRPVKSRRMN